LLTPDLPRLLIPPSRLAITIVLLAFALLIVGCETQAPNPAPPPPPPPKPAPPASEEPPAAEPATTSEKAEVIEVNSGNFEQEVLKAETLVVVDFWAEWCAPCKPVKPILHEFAQEYAGQVKFAALNVDDSRLIANKYKIRAIPCLIFFRDGEEIHQMLGLRSKGEYKAEIDKFLAE